MWGVGTGKRKERFPTWYSHNLAVMPFECGRCPNALTSQAKHFDSFLETYQEPLISNTIMGMRHPCGLALISSAWVLKGVLGPCRINSPLLVLLIGNQYSQFSLKHLGLVVVYRIYIGSHLLFSDWKSRPPLRQQSMLTVGISCLQTTQVACSLIQILIYCLKSSRQVFLIVKAFFVLFCF